ncbi:Hydrogenase maturation factor HypD [Methanosarcinaceae archaeon Ag5]|uniref:Hydrogenase maturation factor HypD n=1 Tax=Methanolapillus africanus TaxID=3028297 RepID=A0AAE4MJI7_9EURY|nr:Hydrogenase maturation factor HypD [Methanosarcinaceae archaeon Ag5]
MDFISKTDPFLENPIEIQKKLIDNISKNPMPARIMHICGTHERTIAKFGIRSLLPPEIEVLSGPGCPVCVTPDNDIDTAIILAKKGLTVVTFGDMLRVPGTEESLFDARAEGADVRMVYSIDDAIKIAADNPDKKIVFLAIGFETTIPTTAAAVLRGLPSNFYIFTSLKLTPPAIDLLIQDINVDAFIAPGHVAVITGTEPFTNFEKLGYPVVVAGFESYDILLAIALLEKQMKAGEAKIENAYPRAVKPEGNKIALKMMDDVFDVSDSEWRGLGIIPNSGFVLKEKYANHNAAVQFFDLYKDEISRLAEVRQKKKKHCICATILTGKANPSNCPMFGKKCTPTTPVGPCMVSDEGMCHSWYKYCRD